MVRRQERKKTTKNDMLKNLTFSVNFVTMNRIRGLNVNVFVNNAILSFVKPCIDKHNNTPGLKGHLLLHGARMPRGLHDKPVKYSVCALHMENVCDCYCIHHRSLICRQCAKDYHDTCNTHFVPLLCRRLCPREVGKFTESIKNTMSTIMTVRTVL